MKRMAAACLLFFVGAGITACNSGSSSTSPALNLAGTWTVTTTSTQGHGSSSGTATVAQTGTGLGVTGSTTLAASPMGQIVVSQNGAALAGTITNSLKRVTYNFTGTLSNGSLTVTGTIPCSATVNATTTITGTITSSGAQGTYTISRSSAACYYPSDGGTFVAVKK